MRAYISAKTGLYGFTGAVAPLYISPTVFEAEPMQSAVMFISEYESLSIMSTLDKCDLYRLTNDWIKDVIADAYKEDEGNRLFAYYTHEFGRLEKAAFGAVSERTQNPEAMKYDRVRNELVNQFGIENKKGLKSAIKKFSEIPIPDCA